MTERENPTGTPSSGTNEDRSNRDANQDPGRMGRGDEQYKNIETKVSNREYFGDDYEVEQENKIVQEEAKREKESRPFRTHREPK
jgi:hypothetical protein